MNRRDLLSIALYEASRESDVYLDLTRVPEDAWEQYPLNFLRRIMVPFSGEAFLNRAGSPLFYGRD